jgi:hypothetical protein
MPSKLTIIAESIPIVRNLLTKIFLADDAFRPPANSKKSAAIGINQRLSFGFSRSCPRLSPLFHPCLSVLLSVFISGKFWLLSCAII